MSGSLRSNRGSTVVAVAATAVVALTAVAASVTRRRRRTKLQPPYDKEDETSSPLETQNGVDLNPSQMAVQSIHNQGGEHIVCVIVLKDALQQLQPSHIQNVIEVLQARDPTLNSVLAVSPSAASSDADTKFQQRLQLAGESYSGALTVHLNEDWNKVFHEYTNMVQFPNPTIDTPTPLWKVVLVHPGLTNTDGSEGDSALIFILHHGFFDGTSRNRLIREFLHCLWSDTYCRKVWEQTQVSLSSLLGLINHAAIQERLVPLSWPRQVLASISIVWTHLLKSLSARPEFGLSLAKAPGIVDPTTVAETRLKTFSLSRQDTQALKERCQQEGTTMHGALTAAGHLALVELAQKQQQGNLPKNAYFASFHLVSLWKYLSRFLPTHALTGRHFSFVCIELPVQRDCHNHAWTMARQIRQHVVRFRPMPMYQRRRQFQWEYKCRSWFPRSSPQTPPEYTALNLLLPGFSISNNGVLDLSFLPPANDNDDDNYTNARFLTTATTSTSFKNTPTMEEGIDAVDPSWRVQALYACSARHYQPGGYGVFNVQTIHGQLHVGWSYYSRVWSDAQSDVFLHLFQDQLFRMTILP